MKGAAPQMLTTLSNRETNANKRSLCAAIFSNATIMSGTKQARKLNFGQNFTNKEPM